MEGGAIDADGGWRLTRWTAGPVRKEGLISKESVAVRRNSLVSRHQKNIPSKVVSTLCSSSPMTGLDETEFLVDGGGVGRFDSGL